MTPTLTAYAAAAISAASVLLGIILKSLIDIWTDARRRRHEDRVRFLADKRAAYAEHHDAGKDMIRTLQQPPDALDRAQCEEALQRLDRSTSALYFIAPWPVLDVTLGQARASRDPDELKRQLTAFVTAARRDLDIDP